MTEWSKPVLICNIQLYIILKYIRSESSLLDAFGYFKTSPVPEPAALQPETMVRSPRYRPFQHSRPSESTLVSVCPCLTVELEKVPSESESRPFHAPSVLLRGPDSDREREREPMSIGAAEAATPMEWYGNPRRSCRSAACQSQQSIRRPGTRADDDALKRPLGHIDRTDLNCDGTECRCPSKPCDVCCLTWKGTVKGEIPMDRFPEAILTLAAMGPTRWRQVFAMAGTG